jgi:hypothetical protein
MTRFYIFVFRLVLGAIFAVLLARFFFPKAGIAWVVGIGICLVGLAYVTEYFRMRGKGPGYERTDR